MVYPMFLILINILVYVLSDNEEIPEKFDIREKWPNCVSKIYNQGSCGSCYAISAATAFSMRFCIKNKISKIIDFSPQNLVNCLSGCEGEFPDVVWEYMNTNGITTDKCLSYKQTSNECTLNCDSKNDKFIKYYAGEANFLEDEISIKKEIMENGPVTSMMYIYSDYYDYKSGIYDHKEEDTPLSFHSITLIGWGVENNIKYWIIQDSYGTSRGENGYMRIKIGDGSGAGATAYCDKMEGKYNDDNEEEKEEEKEKEKEEEKSKEEKDNNSKRFWNNIYILLLIILFLLFLM